MRWFKHVTTTFDDERIQDYIDAAGKDAMCAYGFFWRVLEIIANQMTPGSDNCSVEYPLNRWSTLTLLHRNKVKSLLGTMGGSGLVVVQYSGSKVRVHCSNLLKYRDEYSRKSGQSQARVRRKDTDTDTDTEVSGDDDAFEGTQGEKPAPKKSSSSPPSGTPIDKNFTPDDECWRMIKKAHVPKDFAQELLAEFVYHWSEVGETRTSWNKQFYQHATNTWIKHQQREKANAESSNNGAGGKQSLAEQIDETYKRDMRHAANLRAGRTSD